MYRELLRAAGGGTKPEALTIPPSWPDPTFADAGLLPRSAPEVKALLRAAFTDPLRAVDPFAALRNASTNARALHPDIDSLPSSLPAFILPSHLLLPGERADFVLFEPRYVAMARAVLGMDKTGPADGRYAHIDDSRGIGSVATIVHHRMLEDGRVAIHVMGGPRCRVVKAARLEGIGTDEQAPPPLLHVEYALQKDDLADDPTADATLARSLLEKLAELAPLDQEPYVVANLPPLLCPERLSFWLATCVLPRDDIQRRRKFVKGTNTYERLCLIDEILERAAATAAQGKGTSDSSPE